jgi:hypothetical protein
MPFTLVPALSAEDGALDLEILDDDDRVTVGENVSVGISHDFDFLSGRHDLSIPAPLVRTFRADKIDAVFVGQRGGAFSDRLAIYSTITPTRALIG